MRCITSGASPALRVVKPAEGGFESRRSHSRKRRRERTAPRRIKIRRKSRPQPACTQFSSDCSTAFDFSSRSDRLFPRPAECVAGDETREEWESFCGCGVRNREASAIQTPGALARRPARRNRCMHSPLACTAPEGPTILPLRWVAAAG